MTYLLIIVKLSLILVLYFGLEILSSDCCKFPEKQQISKVSQMMNNNSRGKVISDKCDFTDYTFVIKTDKKIFAKGDDIALEIELKNKNPYFIRAPSTEVNLENKVEVRNNNNKKNLSSFSENGKEKMHKL